MDEERTSGASDLRLERDMLRAAAAETPPSSVCLRTLARLELMGVAREPEAGASVVPAIARSPRLQQRRRALGVALGLGLAGVAVGTAAAAAIALEQISSGRESSIKLTKTAPSPSEAVLPSVNARVAEAQDPPTETEQTETTPQPEGRTSRASVADVRKSPPRAYSDASGTFAEAPPPSRATEPESIASIREEIDLLDSARLALAEGAPDVALAILHEYVARYPQSQLRREVTVVRLQALRAQSPSKRRPR